MDKIKRTLSRLPAWILSILTTLLILWLTLAPDPLGDDSPQLFEGADKVVHALMFGFLTVMVLLDRQRKRGWTSVSGWFIVLTAVATSLLGILIEVAQREMDMGRGFEVADMAADITGVSLCAIGWFLFQKHWCGPASGQ